VRALNKWKGVWIAAESCLKRRDLQQLFRGKGGMTQVRKEGYKLDPGRVT
jgi:hypothetical protein